MTGWDGWINAGCQYIKFVYTVVQAVSVQFKSSLTNFAALSLLLLLLLILVGDDWGVGYLRAAALKLIKLSVIAPHSTRKLIVRTINQIN